MPVKRWIHGIGLKVRWGVNQAELADLVYNGGLNIYEPKTRELIPVKETRALFNKRMSEEINERKRRQLEGMFTKTQQVLYDGIFDVLFDMDEAITFEQEHGLLNAREDEIKESLRSNNVVNGKSSGLSPTDSLPGKRFQEVAVIAIKKKFISGWKIRDRWDISMANLFSLVAERQLQPYNPGTLEPINVEEEINYLRNQPNGEKGYIPTLKDRIFELLYKVTDIETYEQRNNDDEQLTNNHKRLPAGDYQPDIPTPATVLETDRKEIPNSKTDIRIPQGQMDPEEFLRSLSVSFENDTTVSIIVGNNRAEQYTCEEMGFKQNSETWTFFITMLQDTNHTYYIGIHSADKDPVKNRAYNNAIKHLSNFSKKFVTFLNDKYSVSLPADFKVFKNMKGQERAGTYKAKFHIEDYHDAICTSDIEQLSKEEVLEKLKTLRNAAISEQDQARQNKLITSTSILGKHALKKGWITERRLQDLISLPDEDVPPDDALSHTGFKDIDDLESPVSPRPFHK